MCIDCPWCAVGIHGIDLSVEVRSPIDSPVGVWQLNVETTTLGRKKAPNTYSYDKDIYLLFNPWLKGTQLTRMSKYIMGSKSDIFSIDTNF